MLMNSLTFASYRAETASIRSHPYNLAAFRLGFTIATTAAPPMQKIAAMLNVELMLGSVGIA